MDAPNPAQRAADPVATRIRSERARLGLTLSDLALSATRRLSSTPGASRRPRSVSGSYLCLIEKGHKVPDEPIAVAIAEALGDDAALYRAWVRTRKRADLPTALAAAETLSRLLPDRAERNASTGAAHSGLGVPPVRLERISSDRPGGSHARLRLPVIAEDTDPGEGVRPACEVIEWLRLDPELLAGEWRARLDRPFAIRLTAQGIQRVSAHFEPGAYALVLRDFMPLRTDLVYALRHEGRLLLSRVLWNGSHVVALPAAGESDFALLEARDATHLREQILGIALAAACTGQEP